MRVRATVCPVGHRAGCSLGAPVFDVAPLANCAKDKYGNDAHAAGSNDSADERAKPPAGGALAAALHPHQAVADETTRKTAHDDRGECDGANSGRWQSGKWTRV